ncbi:hypothetical protein [Viscerimonas tarda]
MKTTFLTIVYLLISTSLFTQTTKDEQIKKINIEFDNKPYWEIKLDYNQKIDISDSLKIKVLKALNQEIPIQLQYEIVHKNNFQQSDSIFCIHSGYGCNDKIGQCIDSLLQKRLEKLSVYKKNISRSLILATGTWGIEEAIPILLKHKGEENYPYPEVEMALAKLGVDSCKKELLEQCTLEYVLSITQFSTTNKDKEYFFMDDNLLFSSGEYMDRFYYIGNYIKDINPLINMIDLLDIEGRLPFQDRDYLYMDASMLSDLHSLFKDNPRYSEWAGLVNKFIKEAHLDTSKRRFFMPDQKVVIKKELKQWIISNVDF